MSQQLQIRNSTVDFLVFTKQNAEDGISVMVENDTVWLTQDAIATLFDKGRSTIAEHLRNIFETGELQAEVVCRKFRQTTKHGAIEGKTQTKVVTFYNLDYAERQARKQIPMTMEDWAKKLDVFLQLNDEKILQDAGSVSHEIAQAFAESEFEKYRVLQDQTYESDFDLFAHTIDKE